MPDVPPRFVGLIPYLYYDDAAAAADWLVRHLGFELIRTFTNEAGRVQNVELRAGSCEIWLDDYPGYNSAQTRKQDIWIGVIVDDLTEVHRRVLASGLACPDPVDRSFGFRELTVVDPGNYHWGFVERYDQVSKN